MQKDQKMGVNRRGREKYKWGKKREREREKESQETDGRSLD
jgi:hypothetical protein